MPANFIKIGDHPETIGGDFERETATALKEKLSNRFLIISNTSLPTKSSFFYEYDLIIISPFLCEVVEIKCIYPSVTVYEDCLESIGNYNEPRIFSLLDIKARVLRSRLKEAPFFLRDVPRIDTRVIVPDSSEITFKYKQHKDNNKTLKIQEAVSYYRGLERIYQSSVEKNDNFDRIKKAWQSFADQLQANRHSKNNIGRFLIRKRLDGNKSYPEYQAMDEPPGGFEVHLKEYPFEPDMNARELESYLEDVTREMQILRGLRHQFIHCVTGHFHTGHSLVQISDWFDGKPLENCWGDLSKLSLTCKLGLMIKIVQGLDFCHERGVFHRNIGAESILVSDGYDDIRISGFGFSKDSKMSKTLTDTVLNKRDPRILCPEEIKNRKVGNYRLSDIYQTGLLFFRIIENGKWPFETSYDYVVENASLKEMKNHRDESSIKAVKKLFYIMVDVKPGNRIDLMSKVEKYLMNCY